MATIFYGDPGRPEGARRSSSAPPKRGWSRLVQAVFFAALLKLGLVTGAFLAAATALIVPS